MPRSPILSLMIANRAKPRAIRMQADGEEATIYLYDVIGAGDMWGDGETTEDIVKAIRALDAKRINIRINSPGGDVFAARAIGLALRQHPAKIVAHIDGVAASAASVIAMYGDEIEIAEGGMIMIHLSWGLTIGNAIEHRETADLLDKVDASLAKTYADRTGIDEGDIRSMLEAETWLDAEESVAKGFADRVAEGKEAKAQAKAPAAGQWDLSAYKHPPRAREAPPPDQLQSTWQAKRETAVRRAALYQHAAA